jgi:hypothetical protein
MFNITAYKNLDGLGFTAERMTESEMDGCSELYNTDVTNNDLHAMSNDINYMKMKVEKLLNERPFNYVTNETK